MPELTLNTPTIQVTIRDTSLEAPWGSGLTNPCTRRVTISANCAVCGGPRGERRGRNSCDDGVYYWVEEWDNPCGHIDHYDAVAKEAAKLIELRQDALLQQVNPGDEIHLAIRGNYMDVRVIEVDIDKREINCVRVIYPDEKGWVSVKYVVLPEAGS